MDINSNIKRAYLIYPDSIDDGEKEIAEKKNLKITTNGEYSPLNGIISQDKIFNLIEEYALRNKTPSQIRDIKGNNFVLPNPTSSTLGFSIPFLTSYSV